MNEQLGIYKIVKKKKKKCMVLKMKNIFVFSSKPLQNVIYQANRDFFYMPIIVVKQIYDRQLKEKVVAKSIVEAPY